jgi:hypothetical protein
MVDLPQPEGPTSATNSPSATRSVVFASAGTALAPRPNVTDVFDNSIAIGTPPSESGCPANSEAGCMRIIKQSACKRDASETDFQNQRLCDNPRTATGFELGNCLVKVHAIQALNCRAVVI